MASIFSRIIRGEIPAERVYETENELAFLDIHPKSAGHTLIVPRSEVAAFHDLPDGAARSLITTVQVVARGICRAMGTEHYNLVVNNGAAAGQVVYHVHFHIIPRYQGASPPRGDLPAIGEKIRQALQEIAPARD